MRFIGSIWRVVRHHAQVHLYSGRYSRGTVIRKMKMLFNKDHIGGYKVIQLRDVGPSLPISQMRLGDTPKAVAMLNPVIHPGPPKNRSRKNTDGHQCRAQL